MRSSSPTTGFVRLVVKPVGDVVNSRSTKQRRRHRRSRAGKAFLKFSIRSIHPQPVAAGGTGMGLAISRSLFPEMKGRDLSVIKRHRAKGSCFKRLTLPSRQMKRRQAGCLSRGSALFQLITASRTARPVKADPGVVESQRENGISGRTGRPNHELPHNASLKI